MEKPEVDACAAHRHFAAHCFNAAWDLMDKPDRSESENLQMLLTSAASLWHWGQREDCSSQNLSIGYWQLARVCTQLGEAALAMRMARSCLAVSSRQSPFYVGYAYEALARAAALAGDKESTQRYLSEAHSCAAGVAEADDRAALLADLKTIRG